MKAKLELSTEEHFARIRGDIRLGLPINFKGGAFFAIEHLRKDRFQKLRELNLGLSVGLSANRATDLKLSHDPSRPAILRLGRDYPFEMIKALADPSLDLDYPGKGPLAQCYDFENIENILSICKAARTLPAVIICNQQFDGAMTLPEVIEAQRSAIEKVSSARVPLKFAQYSNVHVFRPKDIDEEHFAISISSTAPNPVPLVRIHSACFTGDCLGSLKCDCGPQLHGALKAIDQEGGALLYLSQEGRGIGMANKMRAYKLQDQGFDTVEANRKLGFDDDERDFEIAAEMLRQLGITKLKLLTNNPRKLELLSSAGIEVVDRVPLIIEPNPENEAYLHIKAKKSGHLL